jgi:murein DD-endopeptidase MepM/ murein hydrolase activator NlpD
MGHPPGEAKVGYGRTRHRVVWVSLSAVAITAIVGAATVLAGTVLSQQWPGAWANPLGGNSVSISTQWGAFSAGCAQVDTSVDYNWYLPRPDRSQHLGLDLATPRGRDVYAIASGRIRNLGTLWNNGGTDWRSVVEVEHRGKKNGVTYPFTAVYGHIELATNPRMGRIWTWNDVVHRGDKLGRVSALITGDHLHFGLRAGVESVPPTNRRSVTDGSAVGTPCIDDKMLTEHPITYLSARDPVDLNGSIVGWKNPTTGAVVSWRVVPYNGRLERRWIKDAATYWCIRGLGAVDWGPMPNDFLNQLPDRTNVHATCN